MALSTEELRSIPLFSGLDTPDLEKVRGIGRLVEVGRKEVLFREGEPVAGIFVLLDGRVKIYRLSPEGKEHILHVIHPGQTFAEAAVFMPQGYPAYAEALSKSRAVLLPKEGFIELLRREPTISLNIITTLSRYLKQFADRIDDLSLKDVSARLARWFLQTADEVGREFWDLDITKTELASQMGTVSETLSRTLRRFKEEGWVQVRGRFVKILNRPALQAVAEGASETNDR
jgi:CRP/FNR family transcriptional regulator